MKKRSYWRQRLERLGHTCSPRLTATLVSIAAPLPARYAAIAAAPVRLHQPGRGICTFRRRAFTCWAVVPATTPDQPSVARPGLGVVVPRHHRPQGVTRIVVSAGRGDASVIVVVADCGGVGSSSQHRRSTSRRTSLGEVAFRVFDLRATVARLWDHRAVRRSGSAAVRTPRQATASPRTRTREANHSPLRSSPERSAQPAVESLLSPCTPRGAPEARMTHLASRASAPQTTIRRRRNKKEKKKKKTRGGREGGAFTDGIASALHRLIVNHLTNARRNFRDAIRGIEAMCPAGLQLQHRFFRLRFRFCDLARRGHARSGSAGVREESLSASRACMPPAGCGQEARSHLVSSAIGGSTEAARCVASAVATDVALLRRRRTK